MTPKRKVRIIWDPIDGAATADGHAKDMAKFLLNQMTMTGEAISIGQESLINEFRLLVKNGIIHYEDIEIQVDGEKLTFNKRGGLSKWPPGFCDLIINQAMELMKGKYP